MDNMAIIQQIHANHVIKAVHYVITIQTHHVHHAVQ